MPLASMTRYPLGTGSTIQGFGKRRMGMQTTVRALVLGKFSSSNPLHRGGSAEG
jgi:hypothetical protein